MDIVGMGVDLAEISRVRRLLAKGADRFRERCFTDHEWEYAHRFKDPSERLAARFAGKEAVMKSLGVGWRHVPWKDIEITGGGQPHVRLFGKAALRAESIGVRKVLVTITHTGNQALVMAISMGEER
jgi:holo-[acyl-carrier protein] synthase